MPIKIRRGRTIRTGKAYTDFRYELWVKQEGQCVTCERQTFLASQLDWDNSFHVDHINGRGMGGSKRDDTFKACQGLCGHCHRVKHHQEAV